MKRIMLFAASLILMSVAVLSCKEQNKIEGEKYSDKEAVANIFGRKSVRYYTAQEVEQEKIDLILRAAMAAPSAMDRRPWEFVVINGRETMDSLSAKLPYAKMLEKAPLAIVVCGNAEISSANWMIDCSAATQNLLLAAEALGLGAVWTGVYPSPERVAQVSTVIGLPENIIPLAVVPIGYPDGDPKPKDKYDPDKIHIGKW